MSEPVGTTTQASAVIEQWADANPGSRALHERARAFLPDGVVHDVRRAHPFPLAVAEAKGARKWDVDGHELICYVMGHGALLLGHGHPAVVDAIRVQAGRFLHPGACHELEVEWAQAVVQLVPSAELVRFTSSGTEATLLALHVARAATGRPRVVKLLGHFHGWNDYLALGSDPPFDEVPPGVPAELGERLVTVVPPDAAAVEQELEAGDVAAVIVEPAGALSGAVPLPDGLLEHLRAATRRHGTLLIFDEVVTGFRWAPGGAQELTGVLPDLTTLGKLVAGGMPGGALAGRADVMQALSTEPGRPKVHHTGTHNAHPVTAAAGIATLRLVADGQPQRRAAASAEALRQGFNEILQRAGAAGFAYGPSSHFCLLLGVERPDVPDSTLAERLGHAVLKAGIGGTLSAALHCAMLLEGVHLFHGHGFLSSAHSDADLDRTLAAFETTVARLQHSGLL